MARPAGPAAPERPGDGANFPILNIGFVDAELSAACASTGRVLRFDSSPRLQREIDLREGDPATGVAEACRGILSQLGYSSDSSAVARGELVLCFEDRDAGYLAYDRAADGAALALVETVTGEAIRLSIYGPPDAGQRIGVASLVLRGFAPVSKLRPPQQSDPRMLHRWLLQHCEQEIPVGVYAWETLLRTGSTDLHRFSDPAAIVACCKNLEAMLQKARIRLARLASLYAWLKPVAIYGSHDCYLASIESSLACKHAIPLLHALKGNVNHYYPPGTAIGGWQRLAPVPLFRSRLSLWLEQQLAAAEPCDADLLAAQEEALNKRTQDLNTLHYMKITPSSEKGFQHFQQCCPLPDWQPRPSGSSQDSGAGVQWVFAFHSFSDQAYVFGGDDFATHYQYFMGAARHIASSFPGDTIVLRPHPNYLEWCQPIYFEDPAVANSLTQVMDIQLQLAMAIEISQLHPNCILAGPTVSTGQILADPLAIVVTKHGSIVPEAIHLGRRYIYSRTAPYSSIADPGLACDDPPSQAEALNNARRQTLDQQQPEPVLSEQQLGEQNQLQQGPGTGRNGAARAALYQFLAVYTRPHGEELPAGFFPDPQLRRFSINLLRERPEHLPAKPQAMQHRLQKLAEVRQRLLDGFAYTSTSRAAIAAAVGRTNS